MSDQTAVVKQIDWSAGFQVVAGHMNFGLTEPSPETKGFWEGVARNELQLKRCRGCRRYLHPRRMACPDCHKAGVEWAPASGIGKVYSFSTIHRAPNPELAKSVPYCVGIVHLREDVYLFTRFIVAQGTEPEIGDTARLEFRILENGQKLPVFAVSNRQA